MLTFARVKFLQNNGNDYHRLDLHLCILMDVANEILYF